MNNENLHTQLTGIHQLNKLKGQITKAVLHPQNHSSIRVQKSCPGLINYLRTLLQGTEKQFHSQQPQFLEIQCLLLASEDTHAHTHIHKMYIYHLSLSKFYQDFKIIPSTRSPFWMFSGLLSTVGWGVNICIHATVNTWRSDDNLWETVLYLYHLGPMNQPRWGHIFYTILKRCPYILAWSSLV